MVKWRAVGAVALCGWAAAAEANEAAYHDPDRGCGEAEAFVHSGRIADLPGCDRELPKNPPAAERAMHDAKVHLRAADRLLTGEVQLGVDRELEAASRELTAVPGWALPHYQR